VLAAAGVVLATVVATSFALFSDQGEVTATLSSGSVDLKYGPGSGADTHQLTFSGGDELTPGATVTDSVQVYNTGSLGATMSLTGTTVVNSTSAGGDALEDDLTLTIVDDTTSTTLYDGPLVGAQFAAGTSVALPANTSASTGFHTLEFTVTVSSSATSAVAGQSIDVSFDFVATQTP
jgi:hypothetical protein